MKRCTRCPDGVTDHADGLCDPCLDEYVADGCAAQGLPHGLDDPAQAAAIDALLAPRPTTQHVA